MMVALGRLSSRDSAWAQYLRSSEGKALLELVAKRATEPEVLPLESLPHVYLSTCID